MHLQYTQKRNGLFILRKSDIEDIATDILREYAPHTLSTPSRLDENYLAQECLGLDIRDRYITPNASILGLIAFSDTVWPVLTAGRVVAEPLPEGTMLVDASLLGKAHQARRRFTVVHEASHFALHRSYNDPSHRIYEFRHNPSVIACREATIERYGWHHNHVWSDDDWAEWQADSLAAALLMPRNPFCDAFESAMRHSGIRYRYLVKNENVRQANEVINETAQLFGVSRKAAQIRMNQFGLIREHHI